MGRGRFDSGPLQRTALLTGHSDWAPSSTTVPSVIQMFPAVQSPPARDRSKTPQAYLETVPVALTLGACHVPQSFAWGADGEEPGVAERPGGLSSVGTPGSSFLPSTSAGSSGSGPRGRCWGKRWPSTASDPCGGQTEWRWSRKGSLRSPGSVVVGAGMLYTQELRGVSKT